MLPEGEVPYSGFEDQASSNGTLSTKISEEVRRMHETDSFSMGSSDKNGHTTIRREFKNFYHFIRGGNDKLPQLKCETMFIQMLEGLQENEAEVLISAKDKKLHQRFKGLSKQVVQEAFNWDENFLDTTHKGYKKSV